MSRKDESAGVKSTAVFVPLAIGEKASIAATGIHKNALNLAFRTIDHLRRYFVDKLYGLIPY